MPLRLVIWMLSFYCFLLSCNDDRLLYSFEKFKYRYLYSMVESNYMGHFLYMEKFDPEQGDDIIEIQRFAYCYLNSVNEDKFPFGQIHISSKNTTDIDFSPKIYFSLYFDDSKNIYSMYINEKNYTNKNYTFLKREDIHCPDILPCAKRYCPDVPK